MKIFDEKIVSKDVCNVECWTFNGSYTDTITTIISIRSIFGFKYYKIKQYVPYIKNVVYDGEYSTNRMLKIVANKKKTIAKIWVSENSNKLYENEEG